MKKLIYGTLFLALVGIGVVGCKKETIKTKNSSFIVNSSQENPKSGGVVYANLGCILKNGNQGCECTSTSSDDDCSLPTACTAQSSLSNYNFAINSMFTQEQIRQRSINRVRIVEPLLIIALKKDGYPLK